MWDPKDNDAGYRIRPTVSALALTVEELEDKCRVKDHMIQKMADELRHLGRCANWSGTNLMEAVADRPHVDIDFDRRALCTYLKSLPPHGLATVQEKKGEDVEYAATNPLGLSVVRQIFINGLFIQRVRCPGRNKALIHPIDLSEKVYITLNAVTYTGEPCDAVTIQYP
ncbi:hypothetical protein AAG570_003182 [Ranatra chinensis]|uniref:Uncharacterized protein n=1 Tax=Ranatra chinensis TaxID=642074 RepID=A0ABD0Y6N0_9HEMI